MAKTSGDTTPISAAWNKLRSIKVRKDLQDSKTPLIKKQDANFSVKNLMRFQNIVDTYNEYFPSRKDTYNDRFFTIETKKLVDDMLTSQRPAATNYMSIWNVTGFLEKRDLKDVLKELTIDINQYLPMFDLLTYSWCLIHPLVAMSHIALDDTGDSLVAALTESAKGTERGKVDMRGVPGLVVFDYLTWAFYKVDPMMKKFMHQVIYLKNNDVLIKANNSVYTVSVQSKNIMTITCDANGDVRSVAYGNHGDYTLDNGYWGSSSATKPHVIGVPSIAVMGVPASLPPGYPTPPQDAIYTTKIGGKDVWVSLYPHIIFKAPQGTEIPTKLKIPKDYQDKQTFDVVYDNKGADDALTLTKAPDATGPENPVLANFVSDATADSKEPSFVHATSAPVQSIPGRPVTGSSIATFVGDNGIWVSMYPTNVVYGAPPGTTPLKGLKVPTTYPESEKIDVEVKYASGTKSMTLKKLAGNAGTPLLPPPVQTLAVVKAVNGKKDDFIHATPLEESTFALERLISFTYKDMPRYLEMYDDHAVLYAEEQPKSAPGRIEVDGSGDMAMKIKVDGSDDDVSEVAMSETIPPSAKFVRSYSAEKKAGTNSVELKPAKTYSFTFKGVLHRLTMFAKSVLVTSPSDFHSIHEVKVDPKSSEVMITESKGGETVQPVKAALKETAPESLDNQADQSQTQFAMFGENGVYTNPTSIDELGNMANAHGNSVSRIEAERPTQVNNTYASLKEKDKHEEKRASFELGEQHYLVSVNPATNSMTLSTNGNDEIASIGQISFTMSGDELKTASITKAGEEEPISVNLTSSNESTLSTQMEFSAVDGDPLTFVRNEPSTRANAQAMANANDESLKLSEVFGKTYLFQEEENKEKEDKYWFTTYPGTNGAELIRVVSEEKKQYPVTIKIEDGVDGKTAKIFLNDKPYNVMRYLREYQVLDRKATGAQIAKYKYASDNVYTFDFEVISPSENPFVQWDALQSTKTIKFQWKGEKYHFTVKRVIGEPDTFVAVLQPMMPEKTTKTTKTTLTPLMQQIRVSTNLANVQVVVPGSTKSVEPVPAQNANALEDVDPAGKPVLYEYNTKDNDWVTFQIQS
jgi:hypothetical protein